jgi:hypothetical protein
LLKDSLQNKHSFAQPALTLQSFLALGEIVPDGFKVQVLQETANAAYIVLPYVASIEGITDEQLESVASGGTPFIGCEINPNPCILGSITFQ